MGNFPGSEHRGGGFRGGKSGGFQKKRWDSERRGPMTLHKATCSECGKGCEVPFRPTGEKPVYCSDCFAKKRADGDLPQKREFNDRPSFGKSTPHLHAPHNDELKKQITELTTKIDRLVNAVERLSRGTEKVAGKIPNAPLISSKHDDADDMADMDMDDELPVVKPATKKASKIKAPTSKIVTKKSLTKKKK